MIRRRSTLLNQWGLPLGLALLTLFGLFSALLGQGGIWWALSWIALVLPLLVAFRHILRASISSGGSAHARPRRCPSGECGDAY